MRNTLHGWLQIRRSEFRKDLLALIGASTPGAISDIAMAHAQAIARTFTAMTMCKRRGRPLAFSTAEVDAYLRRGNNLARIDRIWNQVLEGR